MLSKADKYRQIIYNATKRILLFPSFDKQEKKSTVALGCNIKLPSSHPFRSSQQIENNMPITHHITYYTLKQYPTTVHNQWPKSCIGLVLCEHHQKNQIFYVYGTGILIHEKIVLTSAQNVYCRRLNKQYTNIRFIVGISGNKCSGIYDAKRVHYPKEYTMQEQENYNFAVLHLSDDLSESCGYVGWKTAYQPESKILITYGYVSEKQEGWFKLREGAKHEKSQDDQEYYSGSAILFKDNQNKYSLMGLQNILERKRYIILSEKIRSMINQWTCLTTIKLRSNNIGTYGCKYLSKVNYPYLNTIQLSNYNINTQGCKYLSKAQWTYLTTINLPNNNIGAQGCQYLSQANWAHLTTINLKYNNIEVIFYRLLLLQLYPNEIIKI